MTTKSEYREVAKKIRTAIENGTYPRGSKLPTEDELAEELSREYGRTVNRATVNKALRILVSEGLVRVHRGVGTIVSKIPPILRDATSRYSKSAREKDGNKGAYNTELANLGLASNIKLTVERAQPPADVAEILGVDPDAESTIRRHRLMYAGDHPMQIATTYISREIGEGTQLEKADSGPGGIVSRFEDLGFKQAEAIEDIVVRPPTEEEAAFLRMDPDQRVYAIRHTGVTGDGLAVEVTEHVIATHQYKLRYRIPMS